MSALVRADFLRIAALVGELWPGQAWPPGTINAAYEMFLPLQFRSIEAAVREIAKEGRSFAPPPGVVFVLAQALDISSRPALPEPDLIRDLTPEELERSRGYAARLRAKLKPKQVAS